MEYQKQTFPAPNAGYVQTANFAQAPVAPQYNQYQTNTSAQPPNYAPPAYNETYPSYNLPHPTDYQRPAAAAPGNYYNNALNI